MSYMDRNGRHADTREPICPRCREPTRIVRENHRLRCTRCMFFGTPSTFKEWQPKQQSKLRHSRGARN